jgi:hypothetical protein
VPEDVLAKITISVKKNDFWLRERANN